MFAFKHHYGELHLEAELRDYSRLSNFFGWRIEHIDTACLIQFFIFLAHAYSVYCEELSRIVQVLGQIGYYQYYYHHHRC